MKPGDHVMSSGGIYGEIVEIKGERALIDVGGGMKLQIAQSHLQGREWIKDQRVWAAGGFILVALFIWFLTNPAPPARNYSAKPAKEAQALAEAQRDLGTLKAKIEALSSRVDALENANRP